MERQPTSRELQDRGLKTRFKRAAAAFIRFATAPQARREAAELRQQEANERAERDRQANAKELPVHLRVGPDAWRYDTPRPVAPALRRPTAAEQPLTLPGRLAQIDGGDTLRSPAAKRHPVALPGRTVPVEKLPEGTPPWAIVSEGWKEGDQEPRPGTLDQAHPTVTAGTDSSASAFPRVGDTPTLRGATAEQPAPSAGNLAEGAVVEGGFGWPEGEKPSYDGHVLGQGYPLPPAEGNPADPTRSY